MNSLSVRRFLLLQNSTLSNLIWSAWNSALKGKKTRPVDYVTSSSAVDLWCQRCCNHSIQSTRPNSKHPDPGKPPIPVAKHEPFPFLCLKKLLMKTKVLRVVCIVFPVLTRIHPCSKPLSIHFLLPPTPLSAPSPCLASQHPRVCKGFPHLLAHVTFCHLPNHPLNHYKMIKGWLKSDYLGSNLSFFIYRSRDFGSLCASVSWSLTLEKNN